MAKMKWMTKSEKEKGAKEKKEKLKNLHNDSSADILELKAKNIELTARIEKLEKLVDKMKIL